MADDEQQRVDWSTTTIKTDNFSKISEGTYTGTCSFSDSGDAYGCGTATFDANDTFSNYLRSVYGSDYTACCESNWYGSTDPSAHANILQGPKVYFSANVKNTADDKVSCTIRFSKDDFSDRIWTTRRISNIICTFEQTITSPISGHTTVKIFLLFDSDSQTNAYEVLYRDSSGKLAFKKFSPDGQLFTLNTYSLKAESDYNLPTNAFGSIEAADWLKNNTISLLKELAEKVNAHHAGIKSSGIDMQQICDNIDSGDFADKLAQLISKASSDATHVGGENNHLAGTSYARTSSDASLLLDWLCDDNNKALAWQQCDQEQIYKAVVNIEEEKRFGYIDISKSVDSNYNAIYNASPYYTIEGTTFGVYSDSNCSNLIASTNVYSKDGGLYIDSIQLRLNGPNGYGGKTLYVKETKAGHGMNLYRDVKSVRMPTTDNSHVPVAFTNSAIADPPWLNLQKVSNKTGDSDFSGTINASGATYKVEYHALQNNGSSCSSNVTRTWTYKTNSDGYIDFADEPTSGTPYRVNGRIHWPVGNYIITEVDAPDGLAISNDTFKVEVRPTGNASAGYGAKQTLFKNNSEVTTLSSDYTVKDTEPEQWGYIELNKIDYDRNTGSPQGNASLSGAVYTLYTTSANFTDTEDVQSGSATTVNQQRLYPVQVKDSNGTFKTVTITTNASGYGKTSVSVPYSDTYKLVETKAPTGYKLDSTVYAVNGTEADWNNGETTAVTVGTANDRKAAEHVFRDGLSFYKTDTEHQAKEQGNASPNGIRYAIVNRSTNPVVMLSSVDGYTVNTSHVKISNGTPIDSGKVVAILTTYTNGNTEGYAEIYGLPYGKYDVYELRKDATIAVNETYNSSTKLGSSVYANDSYLFDSTQQKSLDLTDADTHNNSSSTAIAAHSKTFAPDNLVFRDGFSLYKNDADLGNAPQGNGTLNNIRYAVINLSDDPVYLYDKYSKVTATGINPNYIVISDGKAIQKNQIAAVLTTHTYSNLEGYISIYGLPYGKYKVVELRTDADESSTLIGKIYNKSGSNFGTSLYANISYNYDENPIEITLQDSANHKTANNTEANIKTDAAFSVADHVYRTTDSGAPKNSPTVDGFFAYKQDIEHVEAQGDGSLNNIKFAVVNTSNHDVVLHKEDVDKIGSYDASFVNYTDDKVIKPGQIVAILTTHFDGGSVDKGKEGYIKIYGLPYGTYHVYELNKNSKVKVGDAYSGANTESVYSNTSYEFMSNDWEVNLTDAQSHNNNYSASMTATLGHNGHIANNYVLRDGFYMYKNDDDDGHQEQGDGSLNDIKFAVVNRSKNEVVLYNKYTKNLTVNGITSSMIEFTDSKVIEPGQIAAFLTSYTYDNMEGYISMYGLPYGTYEVIELRADNTLKIGDNYDSSTARYGSSAFANKSYLWKANTKTFTLTDTDHHPATNDDVANATKALTLHNDTTTFENVVYKDGFSFYKHDADNIQENEEDFTTEGDASANNIRFIVVNRSEDVIRVHKSDVDKLTNDAQYITYKDNVDIAPGSVAAILTTHNHTNPDKVAVEGYVAMYGLPYGKYDVYELRKDATIKVGDVYNPNAASMGSSVYANESFLYEDNILSFDLTDTITETNKTTPKHSLSAEACVTYHIADKTGASYVVDDVFRDGFEFYKTDIEMMENSDSTAPYQFPTSNHGQGDASLNDIRFAVVNTSGKSIRLFNDYNIVETDYVDIIDGKKIMNGQIAAIITTHNKNGVEGYAAMYGLPYGTYEVYELRVDAADALSLIGTVYNGNGMLGDSNYANLSTGEDEGYLFKNNSLEYNLTDTESHPNGNSAEQNANAALNNHHEDVNNNTNVSNYVFRDGFEFYKKDIHFDDAPQGDSTLNDIRFAVVNRSDFSIKLFDKYNIIDSEYVTIKNGMVIDPNEVAAILTTHDKDNIEGYMAMYGLPYGTYEVYELREDATITIGDNYDNPQDGRHLGESIYVNNASYLYNVDDPLACTFTLTDIEKHPALVNTTESHKANAELALDLHYASDEGEEDVRNVPVTADIKITKHDLETNATGVNGNQGVNSFAGIRFAVVNDSANPIFYKEVEYNVGEVVTVVTLDENATVTIEELPYGTYTVHELRMDATIEPNDVYENSDKLGKSIYANTYYVFCDNLMKYTIEGNDKVTKIDYTVESQVDEVRTQDTVYENHYSDLPVRGDFYTIKVDMDGKRMPYIPFLISLVETDDEGNIIRDENGAPTVIESHIMLSDEHGDLNTADWKRVKSPDNVNKLDSYIDETTYEYTGPQDITAGNYNVWFGSSDDEYIVNGRGALLYGTYLVQELRCDDNKNYSPITATVVITEDNVSVAPVDLDIVVNLELKIITSAMDVASRSNVLSKGDTLKIEDKVTFMNLKYNDVYAYINLMYIVDADGNKRLAGTTDLKRIELTEPADGGLTCLATVDTNTFDFDATQIKKGESLNIATQLYRMVGGAWAPIFSHNMDCSDVNERLIVPELSTEAVNETTELRVGSLDPFTVANDKIIYKNLADYHVYMMDITMYDENHEPVVDTNGNYCSTSITFTATPEEKELVDTSRELPSGVIHTYRAPTSGEFDFDDLGLTKFELPNDYINVYYVVSIYDPMSGSVVVDHNTNFDEELETLRWVQIGTVASSADYLEGIIPNATESTIVDTINYENVAEAINVRVDGTVVEKESGDIVTTGSKTFDLKPMTKSSIEMRFTIDSTPYATKDLVVFEKIYLIVDGKDVLIADHSDINDTKQTIRVPEIETTLVNEHKGTGYKVVSQELADVTLVDTVKYTNLRPNVSWTLNGTLMDKLTNTPVKDASGKNVTASTTFTPTTEDGTVDVTFTFKQVLKDWDWEIDESWVAFETLKSAEKGHTELDYAVHADIEDNDQTVYLPKFRTTALGEDGMKQVPGLPNQKIVDTVELRNFDKAQKNGDTFTLLIKAIDVETGDAVLDSNGNPYINTKTFVWNGQTTETIDITMDTSKLLGKTIVFFETLYFGDKAIDGSEVLIEDDINNAEQTITIPEIRTTARDSETNSETVSLKRSLIDTVTLNRITPDTDFVITTKLVDKATGEFIKNVDGTDVVVTTKYHSPKTSDNALVSKLDGTVYAVDDVIDIEIDLSKVEGLEGKDLVVYEYMPYNNKFYAEHADINDIGQTVEVPEIHTTFLDVATDTHTTAYGEAVTVVDTVAYANLIEGKEYKMVCNLMDKTANEPFVVDGKPVTKTVTFIAGKGGSGSVDVEFVVDTTAIEGKRLVAFEECFIDDIGLAIHADIEDKDQTVKVPKLRTTLLDMVINDHMTAYDHVEPLEDTVTYVNLEEGLTYKMVGTLYNRATGKVLVDEDGNKITSSVEFTVPKGSDGAGEVKVQFNIDSVKLAGEHVVAFEECYYKDILVGIHDDIMDDDQMVMVPDIHTTLTDELTEDHITAYGEKITINDRVHYENLLIGKKYTMSGILYNKETGEPILDVDGNEITNKVEFTATESEGYITVPFIIDTEYLKGKTLVAFEECSYNNIIVAMHHDINDVEQTIHIPEVHTTLVSKITDEHVAPVDKEITLVDTVKYENLLVGKEYTMKGTLMNQETNEPILVDNKPVTAETTFVAETANGSVDAVFVFNSSALAGTTVVAFEDLEYKNIRVATHSDITDEEQTVDIPNLETTFFDIELEDMNVENEVHSGRVENDVTLKDIVHYDHLTPGLEYTVTGKVMNTETGEPLTIFGEEIVASTTFIPETKEGDVEVVFEHVHLGLLEGKTIVAFETLQYKGIDLNIHADLEDEDQTILIPEIHTTLLDNLTNDHISAYGEEITLTDTVAYHNLIPGKEYTMKGELVFANTAEEKDKFEQIIEVMVFEDYVQNENVLKTYKTLLNLGFSANEIYNLVTPAEPIDYDYLMQIAVDKELSANNTIKLLETYATGALVALVDEYSNYLAYVEEKLAESENPGDSSTTEPEKVTFNGKPVTGETTFIASETGDGTVDIEFTINTAELAGRTTVAFEELYYGEHLIATHADIEDEDQTVHIPDVHTTLVSNDTENHVGPVNEEITLTDTVLYENLIVGKEYTITGTLMNQDTGEAILDNDQPVTASVTFIAEEPNGSIDVVFTFNASLLENTTVVAFEDLYYNGVRVGSHSDLTDEDQSVHFPGVHTTFYDIELEDANVENEVHSGQVKNDVTLTDIVTYTNLIPGLEYTVVGTIMDKETDEPILVNDEVLTSSTTFVPETADGSVEVVFEHIDTTSISGKTIVAFETLMYKDVELVVHADIDDVDQTIKIPEIHTTLVDSATNDHMVVEGETVLTDTVTYTNLIPGKEYTVRGELVFAVENNPIDPETTTDTEDVVETENNYEKVMYNGEPVIGETTFIADESGNGTVDVQFTIDSTELANKTVVAFEELEYAKHIIAIHADITDEGQTVHIPEIHTTAVDKVDDDKIIDGTSTMQTIVDTVYYENLVPGKTYVVTGKLVVKKDYAENEEFEYVTDKDGKVLISTTEFVADDYNGSVNVEFTIDASKYAGKKLVAFESMSYDNVEFVTHADIEDEDQTITVSLLLHVKIAKTDYDNVKYFLKGAEITIFNQDGTVAKDVDGNDCIGVTDENGEINFTVVYDENNVYYAQETKAPAGYNINNDKFEIVANDSRESEGVCLIPIQIRDKIIIVPPHTPPYTGDTTAPIMPIVILFLCGAACVAMFFVTKPKKSRRDNIETDDESEEIDETFITEDDI